MAVACAMAFTVASVGKRYGVIRGTRIITEEQEDHMTDTNDDDAKIVSFAEYKADADLEKEVWRRICPPDGNCRLCRQPADRYHPVGPLRVTISEPAIAEIHGGETLVHEFCCWECLGHWAAVQAGGVFVGPSLEEEITGEEQGARS